MIRTFDILSAKILIVDDQEANVLLLERMLRAEGYTSEPVLVMRTGPVGVTCKEWTSL